MLRVAIIGASGYTGVEAIEIILRHPLAEVTYLTGQTECGHVADIFGQLKGRVDMEIEPLDMGKLRDKADIALCCLPHKVSMSFVPQMLNAGLKVVDFSADYRLRDLDVYSQYYQAHTDPENVELAAYGLCELFRDQIKDAKLVANPGCFPTGFSLSVAPLLKEGLIDPDSMIVNSVTGVSGAGKKPKPLFHFPNMNDNLIPYGIGTHRHMPEMEQVASDVCGKKSRVLFQPHVGSFDRGILSTVYSAPTDKITPTTLSKLYADFYKDERFVQVLNDAPKLKDIAHTNYCHIFPTIVKGRVVCFAAIDNLIKGASGQAVQNMNIISGMDESLGLA